MSDTKILPSLVLHGHFYQPPREDPWLEAVERQPSAHPFHDWNERVERECYRAVVAARLPGPGGRIRSIRNTLRHISFDFGPTLLEWLEKHARRTYRAVLEADAESRQRLGYGNALAQAYHHSILPLASRREKALEIRWGILDFRRRFGRDPQGMWLPETALDMETLEVLAEEGIAFTVVAPHQVRPLPRGGMPGRVRLKTGRTLVVFPYHGPLSGAVAFGPLVEDAHAWARAILDVMEEGPGGEGGGGEEPGEGAAPPGVNGDPRRDPVGDTGTPACRRSLVALAVDGETFGHHRRFGEMALAALLDQLLESGRVRVENFASFLARRPPREDVEVVEPSSWSCPHGVERWRGNCGCRLDLAQPPRQEWRAPLRRALETLAQGLHRIYLREAPPLLEDPWEALAGYGAVASLGPEATGAYVRGRAGRRLAPAEEVRAAELLEMERNALRLFTSCGWFFDRLEGIEPLQILRYAARAVELAGPEGPALEAEFLEILAQAQTQERPPRDGRALYLAEAKPRVAVPLRVGAGAAAVHLLAGGGAEGGDPASGPASTAGEDRCPPGPDQAAAAADPPGFVTRVGPGPLLWVRHRRTGREWTGRFRVLEEVPHHLRLEVALEGPGGAEPFSLGDLCEPYRDVALRLARRRLAGAWAPEILSLLEADEAGGLQEALGRLLVEAVEALSPGARNPEPVTPPGLLRVEGLARLHALLDFPIPFDAQTEFHRVFERLDPERQIRWSPLLEPLGFEPLT